MPRSRRSFMLYALDVRMVKTNRCRGIKGDGKRCTYNAKTELDGFCGLHASQASSKHRRDDSKPELPTTHAEYAFSNAMYYPFIDIHDTGWLRSAAIYWDKIRTIVPDAIEKPYSSRFARDLQNENILVPYYVNPDLPEVQGLSGDVIRYLDDPEALELMYSGASNTRTRIHTSKLPPTLQKLRWARIHPEKLNWELQRRIEQIGLSTKSRDGWLNVDEGFAAFYMTLLANRLSRKIGAGLLTPSGLSHSLGLKVKADSSLAGLAVFHSSYCAPSCEGEFSGITRMPPSLAQGMLVDVTVEKITIAPDTSLKKILEFRKTHKDELGRFRTEVANLAKKIPTDCSLDQMRQAANDIYLNEVAPAIDALKRSLDGSRVKWMTNGLMKLGFLSVGASSTFMGMGFALPNALLVGSGIALTATGILYNVERKKTITDNPYSYILALERTP